MAADVPLVGGLPGDSEGLGDRRPRGGGRGKGVDLLVDLRVQAFGLGGQLGEPRKSVHPLVVGRLERERLGQHLLSRALPSLSRALPSRPLRLLPARLRSPLSCMFAHVSDPATRL
jgi:hypothetical protein